MGILLRALETRSTSDMGYSTLASPSSWLMDAFGASPTVSGMVVNEHTAMNVSAVNACVRVLSQAVAQLPWKVYERRGDETIEAVTRREYSLLHDRPNPRMSSFVFRRLGMMNLLLWGNFFAEIQYDNAGRVIAMWPICPWLVSIKLGDTLEDIVYVVTEAGGQQRKINPSDMIHVMGMSLNGLIGVSPITWYRQSLGLSLAAENMGASLFGNGAKLSGVLTSKNGLKDEQKQKILEQWRAMYQGANNAQRVALLTADLSFQPLSINPDDAQFLETRKFQNAEVCRWFGVPPHKIADLERATNNNIEHQGIEFVTDSLQPHIVNWEQEFDYKLFDKTNYFNELNIDGLLRGDFKSRQEGLAIQRTNGVINADEWRKKENMNRIENAAVGQAYLVQGAMIPVEKAGMDKVAPAGEPGAGTRRLFLESISEVKKWENFSEKRAAAKLSLVLRCVADDMGISEQEFIPEVAERLAARLPSVTDENAELQSVIKELASGGKING